MSKYLVIIEFTQPVSLLILRSCPSPAISKVLLIGEEVIPKPNSEPAFYEV